MSKRGVHTDSDLQSVLTAISGDISNNEIYANEQWQCAQ